MHSCFPATLHLLLLCILCTSLLPAPVGTIALASDFASLDFLGSDTSPSDDLTATLLSENSSVATSEFVTAEMNSSLLETTSVTEIAEPTNGSTTTTMGNSVSTTVPVTTSTVSVAAPTTSPTPIPTPPQAPTTSLLMATFLGAVITIDRTRLVLSFSDGSPILSMQNTSIPPASGAFSVAAGAVDADSYPSVAANNDAAAFWTCSTVKSRVRLSSRQFNGSTAVENYDWLNNEAVSSPTTERLRSYALQHYTNIGVYNFCGGQWVRNMESGNTTHLVIFLGGDAVLIDDMKVTFNASSSLSVIAEQVVSEEPQTRTLPVYVLADNHLDPSGLAVTRQELGINDAVTNGNMQSSTDEWQSVVISVNESGGFRYEGGSPIVLTSFYSAFASTGLSSTGLQNDIKTGAYALPAWLIVITNCFTVIPTRLARSVKTRR